MIDKDAIGLNDEGLNEFLKKMFVNKSSIDIIREICTSKQFKRFNIDVKICFDKLHKFDEELTDEHKEIKKFINFLLFEPVEYLREIVKGLTENHFHNKKNVIKDFLEAGDLTKLYDGKTPMIISYLCVSSDPVHNLYSREFRGGKFAEFIPDTDAEGNDYFSLMFKSVIKNHEKEISQAGDTIKKSDDILTASFKMMQKIKPHWNLILSNKLTSVVDTSRFNKVKNDIAIEPETALNIYLGDYDLIDNVNTGEPIDNNLYENVKRSLVIYPVKFNRLSEENKLKAAAFLVKWRDNFNKLCVNSTTRIFNNIRATAGKVKSGFSRSMINQMSATFENDDVAESINAAYKNIVDDFEAKAKANKFKSVVDKVSWCVSHYIPIVESLSNKVIINNALSLKYHQFANKESFMNILPLIHNNDYVPSYRAPVMKGGDEQRDEPPKEAPAPRQPEKEIIYKPVYKDGPAKDKTTATAAYIENIINAQKEFNKRYEEAYRQLIASLTSVSTSTTGVNTKLFNCIYALKSIGIDSPKTTIYISGLYAAKNWNPLYVKSCARSAALRFAVGCQRCEPRERQAYRPLRPQLSGD